MKNTLFILKGFLFVCPDGVILLHYFFLGVYHLFELLSSLLQSFQICVLSHLLSKQLRLKLLCLAFVKLLLRLSLFHL